MSKNKSSKLYTLGLGAVVVVLAGMQFGAFSKDVNANSTLESQSLDQYANQNLNQYTNQDLNATQVPQNTSTGEVTATIVDGVQVIEFDLQPNSYPTINVKTGMPVKLIINADENSLNSCNYSLISYDLNFLKDLNYGENIIEFTPANEGTYVYQCWMGMVGANINVSNDLEAPEAFYGPNVAAASCCSR